MNYERDNRWVDLADVLISHSTSVRESDRVLIIMRETGTFPLAREIYRLAVARGAYPQTLFASALFDRDKLLSGNDGQAEWVPELFRNAMEWADVCIDLRGAANLYELSGIDIRLISLHRKAEGVISALRTAKTRWVIVRVPTETLAQQAHVSTDEAMSVFFNACLQDWTKESHRLKRMARSLTGAHSVRVLSADTDLTFSVEGRTFVGEDGRINMPGGELYTSPVEESVEGHITFESPGVFAGLLMERIRLQFHHGRVLSASAETNANFLQSILEIDDGARSVGEFGIGTNRGLTFFSNDILYDEKIFGTVHIALGRSYKECGGLNESALHWDIIKDLRQAGTLLVDGRPVIENGSLNL